MPRVSPTPPSPTAHTPAGSASASPAPGGPFAVPAAPASPVAPGGGAEGGRVIIVGDVHGMLHELQELLAVVRFSARDTLVLVGDLISKGPESAGVVRYLRGMRRGGHAVVVVKGNHEEKLEKFRRSEKKARRADELRRRAAAAGAAALSALEQTWLRNYESMRAINSELSDADLSFLESAVLYHRLPEHGALVVHAGVLPDMAALPRLEKLAKAGKEELRAAGRVMHVRFVRGAPAATFTLEVTLRGADAAADDWAGRGAALLALMARRGAHTHVVGRRDLPVGSFVEDGTEEAPDRFWANAYDGRFGHVYFGHSPFTDAEAPVRFANATALDLGCCSGGRLAAAVLEVGRETVYAAVPATKKYAEPSLWRNKLGTSEPPTPSGGGATAVATAGATAEAAGAQAAAAAAAAAAVGLAVAAETGRVGAATAVT